MLDAMQPDRPSSLLIVILNYRTPDLTIDCLESLVEEVRSLPLTRVVVTDNDSNDGSVEKIGTAIAIHNWTDWVELMPLERNGGYAFGNNAAIRPALASNSPPSYTLLLNPDTVVRPGAIKALLNFMEQHSEVGIAGSRLEDPDGTPQQSAFRFPTLQSELDLSLRLGIVTKLLSRWELSPPIADAPQQTDWVAGASMIVRREVFDSVGLLDEKYFMYFEEVDFCLKAKRAGWVCWYVPESRVVHFVGQSSGVTDTKIPPKRLPTYWFDSRRRFFLKNYGFLYALMTDTVGILAVTMRHGRRMIERKANTDPPNFFTDLLLNSVFVKGGQV